MGEERDLIGQEIIQSNINGCFLPDHFHTEQSSAAMYANLHACRQDIWPGLSIAIGDTINRRVQNVNGFYLLTCHATNLCLLNQWSCLCSHFAQEEERFIIFSAPRPINVSFVRRARECGLKKGADRNNAIGNARPKLYLCATREGIWQPGAEAAGAQSPLRGNLDQGVIRERQALVGPCFH